MQARRPRVNGNAQSRHTSWRWVQKNTTKGGQWRRHRRRGWTHDTHIYMHMYIHVHTYTRTERRSKVMYFVHGYVKVAVIDGVTATLPLQGKR